MTTTQVAVRLDDDLLESLDWLVVRCDYENRAEAIRTALRELARRERSREIGEQIADGYRRKPQTPAELDQVELGGFPGLPDEDWSALR
jgi:Arc/MetJ-type ribon-helix-helix transcriptional regulator